MPRAADKVTKAELAHQESKQKDLEKLVDELMKDQPNKALVKKLSRQLGMAYSGDDVTQISTVLNSMHTFYRPTKPRQLES